MIMSVVMKAKSTLTTLSIGDFKLSNSSFKQISQIDKLIHLEINASNLSETNYSYLSSEGFSHLKKISKLRKLKIHNPKDSQGRALPVYLPEFAFSCPWLEQLEVSGCLNITEMTLKVFLVCLVTDSKLKHLNIQDCGFDRGFVKMMKQKYPHIKIVD